MQTRTCLALVVMILAGVLNACGKDPVPTNRLPLQEPTTHDSLTTEEKANYCFLRADLETGAERQALLDQLKGTWVHHPSDPNPKFRRKEFRLDEKAVSPEIGIAAITTYHDIGKGVDDIQFRKICISKPLDGSAGPYAGYRILELLAANNAGAVAILLKLELGIQEGAKLTLSDRYYGRWDSEKLLDPATVIRSDQFKAVWVYPEKK